MTTTADTVARETGCIQRERCFTGSTLVQTLVFGWSDHPDATLSQLAADAALRGVTVHPQAIDQRFGPELAACLAQLIGLGAQTIIAANEPVAIPLLERFREVHIIDSTTIGLPDSAAEQWPGVGGHPGASRAALKLSVQFDLRHGTLSGLLPSPGRMQDRASPLQHAPLPPGSLRLADQGYFTLGTLDEIAAAGSYWIARLPAHITVTPVNAARPDDLLAWLATQTDAAGIVDVPVLLGGCRLPARLLAWPVPPTVATQRQRKVQRKARKQGRTPTTDRLARTEWTIVVTNTTQEQISPAEAQVLLRARWQIELLFKCWKQDGGLARSRSQQPWRLICEALAKLLACLITHWLVVIRGWEDPGRSHLQAAQVIRDRALLLLVALDGPRKFLAAIKQVLTGTNTGCRLTRRCKHPGTNQLLLDPSLGTLT